MLDNIKIVILLPIGSAHLAGTWRRAQSRCRRHCVQQQIATGIAGRIAQKINFNDHLNRWLVIARSFIVNGASLVNAADPDPQLLAASMRIEQVSVLVGHRQLGVKEAVPCFLDRTTSPDFLSAGMHTSFATAILVLASGPSVCSWILK